MSPEIDHAIEVSEASALMTHAERNEDLSSCKMVDKLRFGTISYDALDKGAARPLKT